jgi:hypothetical protein
VSPEEYDKLREADEQRGSVKRGSWLANKRANQVKTVAPTTVRPLIVLPHTCSTCEHFDGDGFCTLPQPIKAFAGRAVYISAPTRMVCDQHERAESGN